MKPQWTSAMKSIQGDGLQSLHTSVGGSSTPMKLANGNQTSAAASNNVPDAPSGTTSVGFIISPPSSGGAGEGLFVPAKRDDSRDIVSSPGASRGAWFVIVTFVFLIQIHDDDDDDDDDGFAVVEFYFIGIYGDGKLCVGCHVNCVSSHSFSAASSSMFESIVEACVVYTIATLIFCNS
jgi:hypothetical protein